MLLIDRIDTSRLTLKHALVVCLKRSGHSTAEIADMLAISRSGVRMRLLRARKHGLPEQQQAPASDEIASHIGVRTRVARSDPRVLDYLPTRQRHD